MNQQPEKALLNLEEFCTYLGIGKTKARELMKDPSSTFTFKIGNRYYANKKKLDQWLNRNTGNQPMNMTNNKKLNNIIQSACFIV